MKFGNPGTIANVSMVFAPMAACTFATSKVVAVSIDALASISEVAKFYGIVWVSLLLNRIRL